MSDVGRDLFSPFDFDRLVDDGIAFALDKQERSAFVEWFRTELPGYVAHGHSLEPQALGPLSASIGRVLWNAIPLPRLGFRADAIPEPGRNDPCLCGSGRKFKQCCLKAPQLPLIDEMAVWPFLIPKLSDEQRSAAFAAKRVPIPVLAAYSDDLIAEGKQSEAIELLEPCVEPAFSVADDRAAMLIDALANAYDEAMDEEAKMSLLRRAAALPKPSPLRADALARLAAVEMDAGNRKALGKHTPAPSRTARKPRISPISSSHYSWLNSAMTRRARVHGRCAKPCYAQVERRQARD